MKTHKASAKRFRVTGTAKIVRRCAGKQHLLSKKNAKRRKRLSKMVPLPDGRNTIVKEYLGAASSLNISSSYVSGVVAYLGLPEFDGMFPLGFREMLLLNEGSDIICVRVSESLNERFLKQLSICEQQAGSVCISNLTVDHSTRSLNTTAETDMKFQVCYVCKQFGLLEGVRFSLQNDTAFHDNVKSVVMLRKELSIQQYMKPFENYNIKIEPNESIKIEPNECATAEPPCKKARNDEVVGSSSANNASPPASWVKEQFSVMIKGHPQATVSSMEDVD